jgi:hypothetical protein
LAGVAVLAGCSPSPARVEVDGFGLMRLADDQPTCYCAEGYPQPSLAVWATNSTDRGLVLPVPQKFPFLQTNRSRWWLVLGQDSAELYALHNEEGYLRPRQRRELNFGIRARGFCAMLARARRAGTCSQRGQAVFQNARLVVVFDPRDVPSAANGAAALLQQVPIDQRLGQRRVTPFDGQY